MIINIEDFLQPISQDSECGEYLVYDYVYDQIREHLREDDARLSQGVWEIERKKANWPEVINISSNLLKTRTKDVQLLVWIAEALSALYGFEGMYNGIELIHKVSDKFWDNIYPTDPQHRMTPFHYAINKLSLRLTLIPLSKAIDDVVGTVQLADWLKAQYNLKMNVSSELNVQKVTSILLATPSEFLSNRLQEITKLRTSIQSLDEFLTSKQKYDAPTIRKFIDNINIIDRVLTKTLQTQKPPKIQTKANQHDIQPTQQDIDAAYIQKSQHATTTVIHKEPTLQDVYSDLRKIADFLEKHQPQSPAAILVRIAVMLGDKSFNEIMKISLEHNSSVISTISELYKLLNDSKK